MKHHTLSLLTFSILILILTSCTSEEENIPEEKPDPIEIAGNYIGQWTSQAANGSVYTGIPISATIKSTDDATMYEGDFYFTTNFTSCCASGKSDGPITLEVIDNDITAFEYMDVLPSCNGNFKGNGKISTNGRLTIQFTGADCEGEHSNASMFFTKQ